MSDTFEADQKPRRTKMPAKIPGPNAGTIVQYNYIPQSILPNGIDGRTREGRRLKLYAQHIASQIPNSDDPIVRARIVNCAALLVESEKLAWRIAEGKTINPRDLASLTYSCDMALSRLGGRQLTRGAPRKDGSPASDEKSVLENYSPRPRTALANAIDQAGEAKH